ncbi:hypothetical protein D3C80_2079800 [compost metagenome]
MSLEAGVMSLVSVMPCRAMLTMSLFSDWPDSTSLSVFRSNTPWSVPVAYSTLPVMPEKLRFVSPLATSTGARLNLPVMFLA